MYKPLTLITDEKKKEGRDRRKLSKEGMAEGEGSKEGRRRGRWRKAKKPCKQVLGLSTPRAAPGITELSEQSCLVPI